MNVMGKILMNKENGVNLFEFTLARSVTLALLSAILLKVKKESFYVPKDMRVFMSIRTIVGSFTFLGACIAMKNLPVTWYVLIT